MNELTLSKTEQRRDALEEARRVLIALNDEKVSRFADDIDTIFENSKNFHSDEHIRKEILKYYDKTLKEHTFTPEQEAAMDTYVNEKLNDTSTFAVRQKEAEIKERERIKIALQDKSNKEFDSRLNTIVENAKNNYTPDETYNQIVEEEAKHLETADFTIEQIADIHLITNKKLDELEVNLTRRREKAIKEAQELALALADQNIIDYNNSIISIRQTLKNNSSRQFRIEQILEARDEFLASETLDTLQQREVEVLTKAQLKLVNEDTVRKTEKDTATINENNMNIFVNSMEVWEAENQGKSVEERSKLY